MNKSSVVQDQMSLIKQNGEKVNPDIDAFEMEFLQMIGQVEFYSNQELYDETVQDLETIQFDAFNFDQRLQENSLQFLTFKIFKHYNFFKLYHIPLEVMTNFTSEV